MAELPRLNGIIKALEEGSVAFVGSAPADGAAGTNGDCSEDTGFLSSCTRLM
jgi:hypothetical protein